MDVNTMGSQIVHSILWLNWQNRCEDDYSTVETCGYVINLSNKVIKIKIYRTINLPLIVWVWNLILDIAGGKEAEGVWEHGVEENIWT